MSMRRLVRDLTFRRGSVNVSSATSNASSSRPPSIFEGEESIPPPVTSEKKSQQPRRAVEPEIPGSKEGSADDQSTSRRTELSESHGDEGRVRIRSTSPENMYLSLGYDSEAIDSSFKQTEHTVTTNLTTTTTTTTNVRDDDESATTTETFHSPKVAPSTPPPRTSSGPSQSPNFGSESPFMATPNPMAHPAKVAPFTPPPAPPGPSHYPNIGSESPFIGTPKPDISPLEKLRQIQRLHREEKEQILELAVGEYEGYKRVCEEQLEACRAENERLIRELSVSASRITLLEVQLGSRGERQSGTTSQHDKIDSTITTTITTITTTITTVTSRIEQWKHKVGRNNGQIIISNKELEQLLSDLSTASSQMTEIQQSYTGLWRDFSSVLGELQVTVSVRNEKDRAIATLTAEVTQWKNADAAKAEQISTVRRENETLTLDLSAASSRTAVLQQRYDAQSKEFSSVRKDLQTKASLVEERDRTIASLTAELAQWRRSDTTKAEQITTMRRDYEKLQRDHSASLSQTAELQKRYDAQSKELSSVRNELQANKSLVEEKDRTVTTLTAEVDQWKRADAAKAQQFAAEHREREKLQRDLTAFSSQTAELQKRYDLQSREIITIRNELETKISLLDEKEDAITSLVAEVAQMKREDSAKATQIATARREIEQLRQELSSALDRFTELQERYAALSRKPSRVSSPVGVDTLQNKQIEELRRDLASANSRTTELRKSCDGLSSELDTVRDQLSEQGLQYERTIASLNAEVLQWKRSDSTKSEQIATTLKRIEKLEKELSTSTPQLAELQGRYEAQSRDLISLRTELQTSTLSSEAKDRTIVSLKAEIDQWKCADTNKTEEIAVTLKQLEELQLESSSLASQLAELQGRYAAQSRELNSVRNELQTNTSSYEEKDHAIASLTAELEHWKRADAAKAEQLRATIKQFERIQRDVSNSTSTDVQRRYVVQSQELVTVRSELQSTMLSVEEKDRMVAALTAQVEEWKHTNAWKEEHIVSARKQFEDLQRRYTTQMTKLTSQIEQWKHSDAAKAEELTTVRKKLERLQHDLSTSSSRLTEFQQRCEVQSVELTFLRDQLQATLSLGGGKGSAVGALDAEIEQWKRANAAKAQELEQLQRKLFSSSSELEALRRSSTSISEETRKVYEKITTTEVKDYSSVIKLTTMADEWLRADARRAEELTLEFERRNKENEELRRNLLTLKEIYVRAPELKQIFEIETTERYEKQSRELETRLAERQTQLDGVKRFVSTADKYADTMIVQMLQKLNAEVQQNTTFIADCMLQDFRPRTSGVTKELRAAAQKVSKAIGRPLTECLANSKSDDVGLYLPIAFQAYFTYYLHSVISSWTLKNECSQFIEEIYERLQESEAQTVSGRWRSLTRTYISPTSMGNPDAMVKVILAGLSDIVVVAGCAASVDNVQFRNKVSSIISITEQFSKMVWEVVSADFEVTAPQPSQSFEDATMEEDADDDDRGKNASRKPVTGEKVVCSTQLGMTKRMQLESGGKDKLMVTKAKVVVESFLHD